VAERVAGIDRGFETTVVPAAQDGQASFCPGCGAYMARVRVAMQMPFYVERCPNCFGLWCDGGEWEALAAAGLHRVLDWLFTTEAQGLCRGREGLAQERRAMVEKLGLELATQIFELADTLERHPHGDFGVAYLMRKFGQ
jgi:hypothetical protein